MYFRLTNHFFLHIGVPVLVGISFLVPAASVFRQMLLAAALHESFHALSACFLHVPILRLTILPYGCHLRLGRTDFSSEAKIAAAGPLGSFLLFLLFWRRDFGHVNLMLCLLNLLPALPLDGGRLLRLFLLWNRGYFFVSRILRRLGLLIGLCLALYAFLRPSPFFGCIAVLLLSRPAPVPFSVLSKKAARTARVKLFHARRTDSLLSLTHYFSPFYHATFRIRGCNRLLPEAEVTLYLRQNAAARVSDVLSTVAPGVIPPLPR